MRYCFKNDEGLHRAYVANIAMKIYDNQTDPNPLIERLLSYDLQSVGGCNQMAEDIMDLLFK
jgi:hypothetical protein